jgi:hypothetical protein
MDRIISLSVGTDGVEDYASTFADVAELGKALGSNHSYLNVSAQFVADGTDEDPEPEVEEDIIGNKLYFDESTMITVKRAICKGLLDNHIDVTPSGRIVTEIVNALQNEGILFRTRPTSRDES